MYRCLKRNGVARLLVLFPLLVSGAWAQPWDLGARVASAVSDGPENNLKLSFEQRGRYEDRTGSAFGKDADVATGLFRTRPGLTYAPVTWLKFPEMCKHITLGAGCGYFFAGPFIQRTTPGVGPTYLYVFHSYSL